MEVGAAEFTARQLGNLNTPDLSVSAGVGKVRLELTGEWRQDATVAVQMGLGSLELVVPEGLACAWSARRFSPRSTRRGWSSAGEAYYSTNWDSARRRVTVDVDAAFGSIKVLWIK